MALTKIGTDGVKDDAVTSGKIPANAVGSSEIADNAVDTAAIADQAVTLDKLPHGTSSNDGKFLRANNGADPSFETVNTDLVADTSPQLGGDLQSNGNDIDFADNDKAIFGTGGDLKIYHDGSHSIVNNIVGSFQVHDGGTEKFRVSGTGTFFKDDIFIANDSDKINLGAGNDLQIYHSGTNSQIDNNTGDLNIKSNIIRLRASNNEQHIACLANAGVELYNDNVKKFATGSNGVYHDCNGTLHENAIHFEIGQNTNDYATLFGVTNYPDATSYGDQNDGHWARIQSKGGCVVVINSDGGRNDGRNTYDHFSVYHKAGESTNGKRAFSVDHTGGVQFGQAGIKIDREWGNQPSISVQRNCNDNTNNTDDGAYFRIHGTGFTHESWTGGAPGNDFSVNLIIDGGTYATSDRRAKTDIVDCPYGLDVVNKLQPRKYQLVNSQLEPQGDDNINLGFIAQEIKEHIPECVNYLGDEADKPNEKGYAKAYALEMGEVVPVLTKAIQELSAKVTSLETKVAALEAA